VAKGKKDKKREKHQKMLKALRMKKMEKMAKELSGTEKPIAARVTTNALSENLDLLVMALEKLPQDHLEWGLETCFFYVDVGQVTGRHLDNVSIAGKHVVHLCIDKLLCALGFVEPEVIVSPDIPLQAQADENDQHDLVAVLALLIAHETAHARLGHSCTTPAKTMAERKPITEKYETEVDRYMQENMAQLVKEGNLARERLRSKETHWRNKKGR
jgi:hypothetical protein